MGKKYTSGELAELYAGLEKHPEDPHIVYAPEDREIIVPLLKHGFISAAIIPATEEESRDYAARTLHAQEHELRDYDEDSLYEQFFSRGDNLYMYGNEMKLSSRRRAELPPVMQEAFTRLSEFTYPRETNLPLRWARATIISSADMLWNMSPETEQGERQIFGLAKKLEQTMPRRQTNLLVLWQKAGVKEDGAVANFHMDAGMTTHISGHNPMQFLTGELTDEQWQVLQKHRLSDEDMLLATYPELEGRIQSLNPYDMVVFGPEIRSPLIPDRRIGRAAQFRRRTDNRLAIRLILKIIKIEI